MTPEIEAYHESLSESDQAICALLAETIASELPEAEGKVWHGHPVWFIAANPIVGYSRQKAGLRHNLERKPSKMTRRMSGTTEVAAADVKRAKKLLGL